MPRGILPRRVPLPPPPRPLPACSTPAMRKWTRQPPPRSAIRGPSTRIPSSAYALGGSPPSLPCPRRPPSPRRRPYSCPTRSPPPHTPLRRTVRDRPARPCAARRRNHSARRAGRAPPPAPCASDLTPFTRMGRRRRPGGGSGRATGATHPARHPKTRSTRTSRRPSSPSQRSSHPRGTSRRPTSPRGLPRRRRPSTPPPRARALQVARRRASCSSASAPSWSCTRPCSRANASCSNCSGCTSPLALLARPTWRRSSSCSAVRPPAPPRSAGSAWPRAHVSRSAARARRWRS